MKKSVSVLFCLVLSMCLLTGCGNSAKNDVAPGDSDVNRPEINDNVGDNSHGNDSANTDNSMMQDIEDNMNHAGNAVENGMDNAADAVENGVDKVTGNR